MANKKATQEWFERAADIMVRESKTLAQAVTDLELPVTGAEAANIQRTAAFQKVLWVARNKYHTELAQQPSRTKDSAKGLLVYAIQKLLEEAKWDKAIEGILKLAKLEGWTEAETQVNVFADLNQQQYDQLKKKLQSLNEPARPSTSGTSEAVFDA